MVKGGTDVMRDRLEPYHRKNLNGLYKSLTGNSVLVLTPKDKLYIRNALRWAGDEIKHLKEKVHP